MVHGPWRLNDLWYGDLVPPLGLEVNARAWNAGDALGKGKFRESAPDTASMKFCGSLVLSFSHSRVSWPRALEAEAVPHSPSPVPHFHIPQLHPAPSACELELELHNLPPSSTPAPALPFVPHSPVWALIYPHPSIPDPNLLSFLVFSGVLSLLPSFSFEASGTEL